MTAPTRWPRPRTLGEPNTPLQVVEASAGTGKTYFLEHKVVDLLLGADATIDRIVVVTYTEKATAETLTWKVSGVKAVKNEIAVRP